MLPRKNRRDVAAIRLLCSKVDGICCRLCSLRPSRPPKRSTDHPRRRSRGIDDGETKRTPNYHSASLRGRRRERRAEVDVKAARRHLGELEDDLLARVGVVRDDDELEVFHGGDFPAASEVQRVPTADENSKRRSPFSMTFAALDGSRRPLEVHMVPSPLGSRTCRPSSSGRAAS